MKKTIKTKINIIQQNISGMNGKRVEIFVNLNDLRHAGNELIIYTREDTELTNDAAESITTGIKLFQILLDDIETQTTDEKEKHTE